ncbi:integrase, catalytic region, zinc finger, CCHC-type containing protein [Tanacetum coccineum]
MLSMHDGEFVNEYFSHTLTVVNKLRVNKAKIEDVDVIEKILRSMMPRFNHIVCSIEESKDFNVITIDKLQSTLLVHEQRMKPPNVEAFGGRGQVEGNGDARMIIISRDVVFDEEASWDWEMSHKESVLMNLDWGESETLPDATTPAGNNNGSVQRLPKLKYQNDHLCSAYALGKSRKHSHRPKAEDPIQEKLYLLHMDLCEPMRIQSINRRKYILVIVDDYSRKPDLFYLHVFGALCYPTNDGEDFGKLKPKADIGIFVGYAPAKKAFRIYNKRTQMIIGTIHVDFDELTAMASEQFSSGPEPKLLTHGTISSGLVPNIPSSTPYVPPTKNDREILFQPMFNEYFNPPPCVDSHVLAVIAPEPAVS